MPKLAAKPWLVSGLIFLLALAYFASMLPRDITWVSVGSDSPDYLIASKYFRIAHPTGEPLYTLLGAAWLRIIPWGSEWWRFSLMSAVFSAGTAALLYAATRRIVAPLAYLASGVVVSQSSIIELYAPVTFFIVLGWWLHEQGHRAAGYAVIGLGLAVHHLAGFMWIGLIAKDYIEHKPLRTALWSIVVGLPWYLYIPLVNRPPFISISGTDIWAYKRFFLAQGGLLGGLAIMTERFAVSEDFRERVWDLTRIVLALGPGLIALVLAVRGAIPRKAMLLPVLIGVITLYWFTDLDPRTYTYMMVPMALTVVLVGRLSAYPQITRAVTVFCAGMMVVNLFLYDIGGRWTDPNHSAEAFRAELRALPEGSVVWSYNRAWEAMTLYQYNLDHGTSYSTALLIHEREADLARLDQVYAEGKLFRTVIVDPASYLVTIIPTTPELVRAEAWEQDLANYQRR